MATRDRNVCGHRISRRQCVGVFLCLTAVYICLSLQHVYSYPQILSVYHQAEFRTFPDEIIPSFGKGNNSRCSRKHNVAYMFNRKTGSTTLVTLIHKVSRKYGLNMNRQTMIHASKENSGFMDFYHMNGINYDSRKTENNPRLLFPANTNLVELKGGMFSLRSQLIDTVFVSIVRNPVSNFRSAYNFFEISDSLKMGKPVPIEEFLSKPELYREKLPYRSVNWSVTHNSQLFHFGLDHSYHNNKEVVNSYLDLMEREIDLVIVTEYYDESLIILKRLLCWDMEDILYLARRVSSSGPALDPTTAEKIEKWNHADLKLYQRFNKTLWRKVQEYGEDFERDLGVFRQLKTAVTDDCNNFNYLRENTLSFLANIGTFIQDGRQYCKHLKSWFTYDTNIVIENRGLRDYRLFATAKTKAYGGGKTRSIDSDFNGMQCLQLRYYQYSDTWSSWFGRSVPALDVYLRISNSTSAIKPTISQENDNKVAEFDINTSINDIQVTTEAKYSKEDIIISAVELLNGACQRNKR